MDTVSPVERTSRVPVRTLIAAAAIAPRGLKVQLAAFQHALRDSGASRDTIADHSEVLRRVLRLIDKELCRPTRHGFPSVPFMPGPPGSLNHFVAVYYNTRDLAKKSILQVQYAAKSFQRHLERPAQLHDLNSEALDGWIAARLAAGTARVTAHQQRGAMLCVWREAARRKLLPAVDQVRRVKVPKPIPRAWFEDEFERLVAAAEQAPGVSKLGVPRSDVLRVFTLAGYYTGLRSDDLVGLQSADVLAGGVMVVRQKKTGEPIPVELPPDCIEVIEPTRPRERELVFPFSRKLASSWLRGLIKHAGLNGSLKWLRRTGATRCEQAKPGSAKAYLGHLTVGLALRHYFDSRQMKFTRPVLPMLASSCERAERTSIAGCAPKLTE